MVWHSLGNSMNFAAFLIDRHYLIYISFVIQSCSYLPGKFLSSSCLHPHSPGARQRHVDTSDTASFVADALSPNGPPIGPTGSTSGVRSQNILVAEMTKDSKTKVSQQNIQKHKRKGRSFSNWSIPSKVSVFLVFHKPLLKSWNQVRFAGDSLWDSPLNKKSYQK